MRSLFLCVPVILCFLLAAQAPKDGDIKKDADKLQGDWKIIKLEVEGMAMPKEELEKPVKGVIRQAGEEPLEIETRRDLIRIDGDKIIIGDETMSTVHGSYKLSLSMKPKGVDVVIGGQLTYKGIYVLEKDELTLCIAGKGQERPTKFATASGSSAVLIVLKHRAIEKK